MLTAYERLVAGDALHAAARTVYNAADHLVTAYGTRYHLHSLYNESASPWLAPVAS